MVHIETIDLVSRGVTLPNDRVGMVTAQPYLILTDVEPYQCTSQSKPLQLAMLTDTLEVACAVRHGASKTHFTIFPEYSIPGLDGVALINAALIAANWPNGTIVIGGTDALSRGDFVQLANTSGTHLNASDDVLNRITQNQWVNCNIIWIKSSSGVVERWLQPKLYPAWPEQNVSYQDMFRGNSVFMFRGPLENGTQYRFCSLVCFDWIATVENQKIWRWVIGDLQQQAAQAQAELSLSWFFVIQCNRKPSDNTFLTEVINFFDQTIISNVRRERACLLFANTAGQAKPGRVDLYGSTGLVFSGQTLFDEPKCHSTFCNGGIRFRSNTLLLAHRDVLFRERGACIHSFLQINPNSLNAGAAGKTIAIQNAFVFPLYGISDPRVPAEAVPACVKWLNDELDHLPSLSSQYSNLPLIAQVDSSHQQNIAGLRILTPQAITKTIALATQLKQAEHADDWGDTESTALEHVLNTLDIVGMGFPPSTYGTDGAHAMVLMNGQTVDLLAIRGVSHETCIEHSKHFYSILPRRQVLLISRDRDNNPWRRRFGSFLEQGNPLLGQERKITDPASGTLHLGYRRLLDIFQQSTTVAEVQGAINVELTT